MSATHPGGATPTSDWTPDELWAYYAEQESVWPRYELIDGELLVSPAPRPAHAFVERAIGGRLWAYLDVNPVGAMFWCPADLRTVFGTVVQPDLFVVPSPPAPRFESWSELDRLLLTVEVLSPGTARHDRLYKRWFYARMGVPEYWIFDGERRLVERSYPDGRVDILDRELRWHPEGARAPMVVDLRALFAEALGDHAPPPAAGA